MRVDPLDHARVQADAGGEQEMTFVDARHVHAAGTPVVGEPQQVLGRVDDVGGDSEHSAIDVRPAPRQAAQRRIGADQAVGRLVDRAIAAEGDDHVVVLACRLPAQGGGVVARLRLHRLHLVAPAQRVHDEVLEPIRDRRRVRIDDNQHPLARSIGARAQRLLQALERVGRGGCHASLLNTGTATSLRGLTSRSPVYCPSHSCTHPEGWRDMAL